MFAAINMACGTGVSPHNIDSWINTSDIKTDVFFLCALFTARQGLCGRFCEWIICPKCENGIV